MRVSTERVSRHSDNRLSHPEWAVKQNSLIKGVVMAYEIRMAVCEAGEPDSSHLCEGRIMGPVRPSIFNTQVGLGDHCESLGIQSLHGHFEVVDH